MFKIHMHMFYLATKESNSDVISPVFSVVMVALCFPCFLLANVTTETSSGNRQQMQIVFCSDFMKIKNNDFM